MQTLSQEHKKIIESRGRTIQEHETIIRQGTHTNRQVTQTSILLIFEVIFTQQYPSLMITASISFS